MRLNSSFINNQLVTSFSSLTGYTNPNGLIKNLAQKELKRVLADVTKNTESSIVVPLIFTDFSGHPFALLF